MKIAKKNLILLTLTLASLPAYFAYSSYPSTSPGTLYPEKEATAVLSKEMILTRKLRARIMADNQLSTEAQNIQIITMPKDITLKGKVSSRAEKVKLENYARSLAGDKKVFNQFKY